MEDYSHLKKEMKENDEHSLMTQDADPNEPEGKALLKRMKYISDLIADVS